MTVDLSVFVLFWSVVSAFLLHWHGFRLRVCGPSQTDQLRLLRLIAVVCSLAWISQTTMDQITVGTLRGGTAGGRGYDLDLPDEDSEDDQYLDHEVLVRFKEYDDPVPYTFREIQEIIRKREIFVKPVRPVAVDGCAVEPDDAFDLCIKADTYRDTLSVYDEYDNVELVSDVLPDWVARAQLIKRLELDEKGLPKKTPDQVDTVNVTLKSGKTVTMDALEYEQLVEFRKLQLRGFTVMDGKQDLRDKNTTFAELVDLYESGGLYTKDKLTNESVPFTVLRLKQMIYDYPEIGAYNGWYPASKALIKWLIQWMKATYQLPNVKGALKDGKDGKQDKTLDEKMKPMVIHAENRDAEPAFMLEIAHVGGYCYNGWQPDCRSLCRSSYRTAATTWSLKGVSSLDPLKLVGLKDYEKEDIYEYLKGRSIGRYWLARFLAHSVPLTPDSVSSRIPSYIEDSLFFRKETISNIVQYLILCVHLYERVDFEDKMLESGIDASKSAEVGLASFKEAIKKFHPFEPHVACRYESHDAMKKTDASQDVMYRVGLCFTRYMKPVDCKMRGRHSCFKENLRIKAVETTSKDA